MLEELKLITPEPSPQEEKEIHGNPHEFLTLSPYLEYKRKVHFSFRNKVLALEGIECDYKVFLDGELVCECVYDSVYNVNHDLVDEILSIG